MYNQNIIDSLIKKVEKISELISENTHLYYAYKVGTEPINKIGDRTTPIILGAYTELIIIKNGLSPEEINLMKMSSCDFILEYYFWSDLIDSKTKEAYRTTLSSSRGKIEKFIISLKNY